MLDPEAMLETDYRVLISSTTEDLRSFRQAVIDAVDAMDGFAAVRMENAGARDDAPATYCRRLVAGNPFLAAAEAAPASVHVRVMRAPIAPEAVARLEAVRAGAERLAVVDGDLWLHLPGGFATSRLATAAGGARIGPGTFRTWNTARRLGAMLEG